MARRYSWNLNNPSRRSYSSTPPPQIACRICNHVFLSTQSLIDHIETHMKEDDLSAASSIRRQSLLAPPPTHLGGRGDGPAPAAAAGDLISLMNTRRNNTHLTLIPNSMPSPISPTPLPMFSPNTITLPSFQERNSIFNPISPPPRAPPQRYLQYMGVRKSSSSSNYTVGLQQYMFPLIQAAPPRPVVEETNGDCTKPFLQLLEKPYPCISNGMISNRPDLELLDLTLKL